MANWQAPSTNNERDPQDVGLLAQRPVRFYLDAATGRVRAWVGADALPGVEYFMRERLSDGVRVLATDNANERTPVLFGASRILIR